MTDLQQSIFNAPVPGAPTTTAPSLPSKPSGGDQPMTDAAATESRGVKRPREEDKEEEQGEESDQDVAMEEESDDE